VFAVVHLFQNSEMCGRFEKYLLVVKPLTIAMSCIVVLHLPSQAQPRSVVLGQVTDAESGAPLENTNVFLSSTLIGTTTGPDGAYRLANIPLGFFQLVGSRVGHKLVSVPLRIMQPETLRIDLQLKPLVLQGREVEVSAPEQKEWKRLLALFTLAFLGETRNAQECRLLNSEVLDLHLIPGTNRLRASTGSVLRVQNQALGYLLSIRIDFFEWDVEKDRGRYLLYPSFEELPTHNEHERQIWRENRREAYLGSLRHFLSAFVGGKLADERFDVHWGKATALHWGASSPLTAENFSLVQLPQQPVWRLTFSDWLRVEYRGENKSLKSYIALNDQDAFVNASGNLADPLCLSVGGDWTRNRVADLLPLYEQDDSHE